jgi:SAM-dependent methyltransferase
MSNTIFQSGYAAIYDLFYQDKNYQQETDYVCSLLTKFSTITTSSILDLGCGTGGHDVFLASKGFQVTGIDQSAEMVKHASEIRGKNVVFSTGNIQHLELNKKFDAVVSLFHVMNYQVTRAELLNCLVTAKKHLNEGGVFIFDFWHGAGVLADPPTIRLKRAENFRFNAIRISEPTLKIHDGTIDVKFTFFVAEKTSPGIYRSFEEVHYLRYWFMWELGSILKEAGFIKIHFEEWMTSKAISSKTWYGCVIAS